jgi:hypothetical protein
MRELRSAKDCLVGKALWPNLCAEREFLAWRSSLETDFRRWRQTPLDTKDQALLMGAALAQASNRLLQRGVVDRSLSSELIEFIRISEDRAKKELTERASLERARDEPSAQRRSGWQTCPKWYGCSPKDCGGEDLLIEAETTAKKSKKRKAAKSRPHFPKLMTAQAESANVGRI